MWNQEQLIAYFVLNLGVAHPVIVRTLRSFIRPREFVEELFCRMSALFEKNQRDFEFTEQKSGKDFAMFRVQPCDTEPSGSKAVLQANLFKNKTSGWTLRLQFWNKWSFTNRITMRKKFYVFNESTVTEWQSDRGKFPVRPNRLLDCILNYYKKGGVINPFF